MGRGVFITGTDTDVGKTWVALRLIEILRSRGLNAVGMKPIECGSYDDSKALHEVSVEAGVTLSEVNPIHLDEPVAPPAVSDPVAIRSAELKDAYDALEAKTDFVVVDGAGGWLVPINQTETVADLATLFDLPVIVVVANRLGCLNHTLLTSKAIAAAGLDCRGVYLNLFGGEDLSQRSNAAMLSNCLAEIPLIDQDLEALADLVLQP